MWYAAASQMFFSSPFTSVSIRARTRGSSRSQVFTLVAYAIWPQLTGSATRWVETSLHFARLPESVPVMPQSTVRFCIAGTTSPNAMVTGVPPSAWTSSDCERPATRTFFPFTSASPFSSALQ